MVSYSDIRRNMFEAQQQERERVDRKRAFEREMKGDFQQNAALQRDLQGTWGQRSQHEADLQRLREDAEMARAQLAETGETARTRMRDLTMRRGQNMDAREAVQQRRFMGGVYGMQDATTRRGQDVQREISGFSYPTVKQYDEMGQVIGESVVPYHLGRPVRLEGEQGGGDEWAWLGNKNLKGDRYLAEFYQTLPPEQQQQFRDNAVRFGRSDILDGIMNESKKGAPGGQPGQAISQADIYENPWAGSFRQRQAPGPQGAGMVRQPMPAAPPTFSSWAWGPQRQGGVRQPMPSPVQSDAYRRAMPQPGVVRQPMPSPVDSDALRRPMPQPTGGEMTSRFLQLQNPYSGNPWDRIRNRLG